MNEKVSAANVLLGIAGHADRFTLKYGWLTFHLKIKPLTVRQLIKISKEISNINDTYKDKDSFFQALMEYAPDSRYICRAIAISTGTPFIRIVSHAVSKLKLKDVKTLFNIVIKQSDAEVFFYTMALAKKMNVMKEKQEQQ